MADPLLIEVADRVVVTFPNGDQLTGAILALPASVGADWHIALDGSDAVVYFSSDAFSHIRLIEKLAV